MEGQSKKSAILSGALDGLIVWLSYGVVSFIIFPIARMTINPEDSLGRMFWESFAITFAAYAVAGLVLGAAAGALTNFFWPGGHSRTRARLLATASLLAIFLLNLWFNTEVDISWGISTVAALSLILLCARGISVPETEGAFWFLTSPLTAMLLPLIPMWVRYAFRPNGSPMTWVPLTIGGLIGAALFSLLVHRMPFLREYRRPVYLTLVLSLLVGAAGAGIAMNPAPPRWPERQAAAREDLPNIVFVVMDTTRADDLSLYGYERPTTPTLEALAKEATLYRSAVSVADYTLSGHASMFTGLYPRSHGSHGNPASEWGSPLRNSFDTMAEILSDAGYRTGAVIANHAMLSPAFQLDQGFEVYDWTFPVNFDFYWRSGFDLTSLARKLLAPFIDTYSFEEDYRPAEDITLAAISLVKETDDPFFLFVNYLDAHTPIVPPPPYRGRYPCSDLNLTLRASEEAISERVNVNRGMLTGEENECLISTYDEEISYLDAEMSKLFAVLKNRGVFDNTLIIVTADHGEGFGEHNLRGHANSVYHEVTSIPMLIKYPGQHEPIVFENVVSQLDLLPTALDVAGISLRQPLPGRSLRGLEDSPSGPVVQEAYTYHQHIFFGDRTQRSLIYDGWKFITSTLGERELYYLADDPKETDNLVDREPEQANRMEHLMDEWLDVVPLVKGQERISMDPKALERLKSLGYAQ